MAFTVGIDGSSYVSVEYANDYFTDGGVAAWNGTLDEEQGALVRATRYIRSMFALRFDPLLFLDTDGDAIIPQALQDATCEYALVELATPGGLAPTPTVDASGYTLVQTKRKIGPLERDFAVAGGSSSGPMLRRPFPVPDALIAGLLLIAPYNRVTR